MLRTFALAVLLIVTALPVTAGIGEGMTAYLRSDFRTAYREFKAAAEQGHARAQYNLGIIYGRGLGVPKDYVLAYMWISLAADRGIKRAAKVLEIVEKRMTPTDVTIAKRMAAKWKPKRAKQTK